MWAIVLGLALLVGWMYQFGRVKEKPKSFKHELNGREVYIESIDGDNLADAFISEAYYEDTGEPLSDDELYILSNHYPDVIEEMLLDQQIGRADALHDEIKGH